MTGPMTEPQDVLPAEIVAYFKLYDFHDVWKERGARALVDWLAARGYALVRTPETLDARGMGAVEAAWFALARDFTYTGPHDRETAHDIVVQHRPAIEAALRLAASPAPDPGAANEIEAPDPLTFSEEYRRGWYRGLKAGLAAPDLGAGLREALERLTKELERDCSPLAEDPENSIDYNEGLCDERGRIAGILDSLLSPGAE